MCMCVPVQLPKEDKEGVCSSGTVLSRHLSVIPYGTGNLALHFRRTVYICFSLRQVSNPQGENSLLFPESLKPLPQNA